MGERRAAEGLGAKGEALSPNYTYKREEQLVLCCVCVCVLTVLIVFLRKSTVLTNQYGTNIVEVRGREGGIDVGKKGSTVYALHTQTCGPHSSGVRTHRTSKPTNNSTIGLLVRSDVLGVRPPDGANHHA